MKKKVIIVLFIICLIVITLILGNFNKKEKDLSEYTIEDIYI